MTEVGGGINPFELDLLQGSPRDVDVHGLPEGHDSLLDTRARSLDHNVVVVDNPISNPATHRGL